VRTAYISHEFCYRHDPGPGHPESPQRLGAIQDRLIAAGLFDLLRHHDAPQVSDRQLLRVHSPGHLDALRAQLPQQGYAALDPDTIICPDSLEAAYRAAGAVALAVDLLMTGDAENAFCAVRPPGHHAERHQPMGFCLFNNVAVGAAHALAAHGLKRVAILDFDVHHGNGTEDIFLDDERVLFCSTFQHPFYPFTPLLENNAHRVSVPLPATAGSVEFRAAVEQHWLPAIERFRPQLILVSAGYDAHADDDMSQVSLLDGDYGWIAQRITDLARRFAANRVAAVLEGGYELHSLARCVEAQLRVLMGLDRG
jgi:acetoin utilization deacetylase AcuC-like enzyme